MNKTNEQYAASKSQRKQKNQAEEFTSLSLLYCKECAMCKQCYLLLVSIVTLINIDICTINLNYFSPYRKPESKHKHRSHEKLL